MGIRNYLVEKNVCSLRKPEILDKENMDKTIDKLISIYGDKSEVVAGVMSTIWHSYQEKFKDEDGEDVTAQDMYNLFGNIGKILQNSGLQQDDTFMIDDFERQCDSF